MAAREPSGPNGRGEVELSVCPHGGVHLRVGRTVVALAREELRGVVERGRELLARTPQGAHGSSDDPAIH